MKRLIVLLVIVLMCGCTQAGRINRNLSKEADNFNKIRKITVMSCITNDTLLVVSGRLSIKADREDNQLEILIETGEGKYLKHFIGLSDNVSYIIEDLEGLDVSKYSYEINFNPRMWVPVKGKVVD